MLMNIYLALALILSPSGATSFSEMAEESFTVGDVRSWASDIGATAAHCEGVSVEAAIGYDCKPTNGAKDSDLWEKAFPGRYPVGCYYALNGTIDYGCEPYWQY